MTIQEVETLQTKIEELTKKIKELEGQKLDWRGELELRDTYFYRRRCWEHLEDLPLTGI